MKKLRLSHTLLSLWEKGDIDAVVDAYFHVDRPSTKQMDDGKKIHEEIASHIQTYNTFPEWFFTYPLKMPECEKEVVVSYNELFDLKGYFDCYDCVDETLFEYKTGVQDSLAWARTYQIPMYFLIAEIAKIPVEKALLIRHDQYIKDTDFVIVHNTPNKILRARNFIDSLGPEIYQYFEDNGLL